MTHSAMPESVGTCGEGEEGEDRLRADIGAAIASATTALAALTRQLESRAVLQQRARYLDAFIRLGTVLLREGREEADPTCD
jgi:hypothetical protein